MPELPPPTESSEGDEDEHPHPPLHKRPGGLIGMAKGFFHRFFGHRGKHRHGHGHHGHHGPPHSDSDSGSSDGDHSDDDGPSDSDDVEQPPEEFRKFRD